ncbi:hypothetical protein BN1708_004238 [Verticillium longisporum]|uniref:Uncharacterized protein n=1 Tax=Verticillium longisporum TaxID=100787 RepID=A0A0G4LY91_VERLO|nr:hypothetical protein BN1708_004238 [Verticillium longisporum]
MSTPTTLRTMRAPAQLRHGASSLLTVSRNSTSPLSTLPWALGLQLRRAHTSVSRDRKSALKDDADSTDVEMYSRVLNPPASTRPAPLNLPRRDPEASTFSHLLATGKAYISFYKTGLKAVFTNRRLLRETDDYLERSARWYESKSKKRKSTAITNDGAEGGAFVVASSGPVNTPIPPEHSEDIRP